MFESALTIDAGGRRPWTVLAGFSGQLAALGFAMLVPLIYTDKLPAFQFADLHILPPVGRPAPPPDTSPPPQRQAPARNKFSPPPSRLTAPARTPDHPPVIFEEQPASVPAFDPGLYVHGALEGPSAVRAGIAAHAAAVAPPPPAEARRTAEAPKPPAERPAARVRMGGDVQAAKILNRVIPAYPPLARQARIAGVVELMGIISRDGRIQQLRVVSGHPLLVPAALEAVRQWTYRPTLLNGEPVEVIAPITVHFTLTN